MLTLIRKLFATRAARRRQATARPRTTTLRVEALEDRQVPTVTFHGGALLDSVKNAMAPGIIQGRREPAQGALLDSVRSATASATPRALDAIPNVEQFVVADFPGRGVWRYSSVHGWQQLTKLDTTQVGVDDRGDVVGEFPYAGVWRYEDATGWRQLTPANVTQLAVDANGNVAVENPGYGVWRYEDATGWRQLTPSDVTQLAIANGNVVVENPGYGVWRYEDAEGWRSLRVAVDASLVSIDSAGDVAVSVNGAGVWRYEDATGWQPLIRAKATSLSIAGDGIIVANLTDDVGVHITSS